MTIPAGASEVTTRDVPTTVQGLPDRETDVVRIIGVTEWGPIGAATVTTDFDEWRRIFGAYLASYYTALEVEQMFAGGVREVVTVRTVHYSGASPATAAKASKTLQTGATAPTKGAVTGSIIGPWALANNDTLIGKVDGNVGTETLTITGAAALDQNGINEPFALSNGQTLTVKIDAGVEQTIAFLTAEFVAIGTATAEEVAAVIAAKITGAQVSVTGAGKRVTITSDRKGLTSYVEITGGTANTALRFTEDTPIQGTGNVNNLASVTASELKTLLEAAWVYGGGVTVSDSSGYLKIEADTAGSAGSVQVVASSTADDEIGLDNAVHAGTDGTAVDTLKFWGKYEGTKGDDISVTISAASSLEAARFNLTVYVDGISKEVYQNLTMDSTDDLYVESVINTLPGSSSWVIAEDKDAAGTPTQRRPLDATNQALTGGNDGLGSLAYSDFVGDEGYNTGLYAFDTRPDEGDLLVCPDCVAEGFQDAATLVCQDHWHMMCVFVPDIGAGLVYTDAAAAADLVTASEGRLAHVWPRVKIPNPDKAVYGVADLLTVPASGLYVARMAANTRLYANTTAEWTQPGNQVYGLLQNAVGIETETVFKPNVRAYLAAHLINPIVAGRTEAGSYGVWVNDVLPGAKTGIWRSVGATRGVARLRKQVAAYMELQRTQPNTEDSRWLDRFRIEAHLVGLTGRGVFASRDASAAFYVNTDPEGTGINNPVEQRAQKYHVIIGLAIAEPKRFIDVGFTRDDRGVESYIQKQLAL